MRAAFILFLASCDSVFGLGGRTEPDARLQPDVPAEMCGADARYEPIADTPARSPYRIVETSPLSWAEAFDDCRNDSMTGITHLVVFDDLIELASVRAVSPRRPKESWYAWAGYARDHQGPALEFTAVTGQPLSTTSLLWASGEPNDGVQSPKTPTPREETIVWWADNNSGIVDGPYDWTVEGYICECDGQPTIDIDFDIRPPD